MKISSQVIRHQDQRYSTVGDYHWPDLPPGSDPMLFVQVSDTGNPLYNFLLEIHEQIEARLVRVQDKPDLADEFDIPYEQAREAGTLAPCGCRPTETSEPGDDIHCPYYREHQIATMIEQILAMFLKVDWLNYNAAIERLGTTEQPTLR